MNRVRALREKLEAEGWQVVEEEWDRLEACLVGECDESSPALRERLDALRPARGFVHGCALSAAFWTVLGLAAWAVLR